MIFARSFALLTSFSLLAACATNDLAEPPAELGNFVLGHNIVVADKMQKVPISRDATVDEWETALKKAMADRFGRYEGTRIYNFGISVDAFALAPPGIPVVISPKSVVVITVTVWDDAKGVKLNEEGKQFTVFEGLSGDTVIGSGLTKNKAQQMETLCYNAVKRVEEWLLTHPEWLDLPPAAQTAALAATETAATTPAAKPVKPVAAPTPAK